MDNEPREYRFGRFTLQPAQRQLLANGRPAKLGARAFDVLQNLLEHRDRPLSKAELLDRVWPDVVVADNNLEVHIWALRKLLGAQAIATIPGRGYRFALPLDQEAVHAMPAVGQLTAAPTLKTNLPAHLPMLIGRADELAVLDALMNDHRFVTLTGAGGIGKTLLAQHLLQRRRDALAHGVCWVELATVDDASSLVGEIAGALGTPIGRGDPLEALATAIAPLSLWLALDNVEHLAASVTRVSEALLARSPGLHLLVTSQVPLGSTHERICRLGPLAVPSQELPAFEALRFGAVELFTERVRAIDPRFVLADQDVKSVCAICRGLDGSALAIELAAARAPLLGLSALEASLDARLELLTKGRRSAPARQQTLRGALEWSHDLLDEPVRQVFRRLSVFAGSFSLDLAQQVLADESGDAWNMVDGLDALVDRSLVAVLGTEPPRYRLLESPRVLAQELLAASGEEHTMRRRHASASAALFSMRWTEASSGRTSPDEMRDRLEEDLDNGRAALAWMLRHDRVAAVALARPLSNALSHNRYAEVDQLWRVTEACLESDVAPAARAHWALGAALHYADRLPDSALTWAQRAREQFRALGDAMSECRALCVIAGGRHAGADSAQRAARDEMTKIMCSDWPPLQRMHVAKAQCLFALHHGDLPAVEPALRRWLRLAEQAGSDLDRMAAQTNLADLALSLGNAAEAVRQGMALERRWRDSRAVRRLAVVRMNLVTALLAVGQVPQAREMALAGWPLAAPFDLRHYWADALALLAALEKRPRACAMLRGYGDAAYAAKVERREPNEAATANRAEGLSREALSDTEFERWRDEGRALTGDDVAALAFAAIDLE